MAQVINSAIGVKPDYTKLTFNKKQYSTLEDMVHAVALSYAKRDFRTAQLLVQELDLNISDKELADALVSAKTNLIMQAIAPKMSTNDLFVA